ncbi:YciI family protein [Saccharothrix sp. S26]|uniref:YciI family protein n=1 Tax=Saccharothrix sp. S26 TaxID=2907215 RepID=UPI001F2644AC|nr:YciI family protein [Saccharothrix sp. S26]MCE6997521.1 YciI family protein [Saccharothrix sp. S26]
MTQYLLSVIEPTGPGTPEPEVLEEIMKDVQAVDADMRDTGVWVFAGGLHKPETATTLRPRDDGELVVTDGPFTETKEHIGGFSIIDVPDLDAALAWGRRLSVACRLPVEVRPFQDIPG